MVSRRAPVLLATFALLVASGCGDVGGAAGGGRVPITSRAIAAVMLDHLSGSTTHRQATYVDEHSPKDYVGADFRYHGGGEDDGDLVRVTMQRSTHLPRCESDRCVDLGGGTRLTWGLVEPEEDPGDVIVSLQRGGTLTVASYSGPDITRDPRTMDLHPSVDELVDLVRDSRLSLRTSPQTVAAGEQVAEWQGGERKPGELDQVRNNDQTVITGFIFGWEHGWRYLGPSPLKELFGPGTIGGRAAVSRELTPIGPGTVDALAAPRPPTWLGTCLQGYTCWSHGAEHFVWKPASGSDHGDAYLIHVAKSGETVALHTVGRYALSGQRRAAMAASGYFLWGRDFFDDSQPLRVGLTTTRDRYEQALETTHG
jgi:hypothetical protein